MSKFIEMPMEPTQLMMFPSSVGESIPKCSEVGMLSEAMDLLDWSGLEGEYAATGRPAYLPKVLCKILVYGLSKGVRSSRVLEDLAKKRKEKLKEIAKRLKESGGGKYRQQMRSVV